MGTSFGFCAGIIYRAVGGKGRDETWVDVGRLEDVMRCEHDSEGK